MCLNFPIVHYCDLLKLWPAHIVHLSSWVSGKKQAWEKVSYNSTSPYEWNIFDWDAKHTYKIYNHSINVNHSDFITKLSPLVRGVLPLTLSLNILHICYGALCQVCSLLTHCLWICCSLEIAKLFHAFISPLRTGPFYWTYLNSLYPRMLLGEKKMCKVKVDWQQD